MDAAILRGSVRKERIMNWENTVEHIMDDYSLKGSSMYPSRGGSISLSERIEEALECAYKAGLSAAESVEEDLDPQDGVEGVGSKTLLLGTAAFPAGDKGKCFDHLSSEVDAKLKELSKEGYVAKKAKIWTLSNPPSVYVFATLIK